MSFASNYSFVERALHRFAFSAPMVQKALSELESDLFKRQLEAIDSDREVFVTGLPRAGTTLMLELLYVTGEFETYTYRDMPFILAPLLWDAVSGRFRKAATDRERAHGDGMLISFDSPEAFEEVVWLAYMADHIVRDDRLETVSASDITEEFSRAMIGSVRKVVARGRGRRQSSRQLRYVSKNNANISRIEALLELFPTACVLVLFRDPLVQTSSLARQHSLFLAEHSQNAFSRQYMKWIGHYEFGTNLKPINFEGWLDRQEMPRVVDATFWLKYWNAAYSHVLTHKTERVYLVDFDNLLQNGASVLERISDVLCVGDKEALVRGAETLRSATTRPVDVDSSLGDELDRARDIHARLRSLAL